MGRGVPRSAWRAVLPALALALVALAAPAAPAAADPPPPGSTWSETYITAPDGTQLHADVLRPKGLAADAKTPVILSIGPYFNHSGQVGPAGPPRTRRTRRSAARGRPPASSTSSTAPGSWTAATRT
jgi:predicted acyl esterase